MKSARSKPSRWTREFELATDDRFGGLLYDRKELARSNEYYHAIHPTEAAEVDARLAEEKAKAEAKAKAAAEAAAAKAAAAADLRADAAGGGASHDSTWHESVLVNLDQIFILLRNWLVGFLPAALRPAAGVVLGVVAIVCVFPASSRSRRSSSARAWAASRIASGPNRVGPYGLFQPVADGIKSLTKEDIVPLRANAAVHFLAPLVLVVTVFMGFAVLPMGRNMVLVDMDAGPALLLRDGRCDGAFGLHGRLVEPQQVLAAGRDARRGADDQL